MKRVGIKDIAKKAGVSIGTVDRVLNNRGEVKDSTRDKVLEIIEELDYKPNLHAKTLSSKKTFRLVAIIPAPATIPYWQRPKEGFKKAAEEIKGFNAEIDILTFDVHKPEDFIRCSEQALSAKPDGLIISPVLKQQTEKFLLKCKDENIPYVFIDGNLDDKNCLGYFGQNAKQSGMAAGRLMSMGVAKYAKILVVNITDNQLRNQHVLDREKGFREFFVKSGSEPEILNLDINLGGGVEPEIQLSDFMEQHEDIQGIFVLNSRVYILADFLEKQQREHVLLIGYDLLEESVEKMRNGVIDVLISQQAYEQGYNSAMSLFYQLNMKREIKRMNYSQIDIIIRENLDDYRIV